MTEIPYGWMKQIKNLVLQKNRAYNAYSRDQNDTDLFKKFQSPQAHLKNTNEESKQKYYLHLSDKL